MIRTALALAALFAALVAAGCGGDDSTAGADGARTTAGGDPECAGVDAPSPKPDGGQTEPDDPLDAGGRHTVTFATSCGEFTVTLDVEGAPDAVTSFAELARAGFYDDTTFHRIVPGFVIQGGDPTGEGTGGPGYKTFDRLPAKLAYTEGVVAMAKTPSEQPGTAGSQFFVVTAGDAGLPPEYVVVGEVTAGMDTVRRIEALGGPDERPQRPVVIESATVAGAS